MERKCNTPNCKILEPLMMIGESLICGTCYMRYYRSKQEQLLNEIKEAGEE